MSILIEGMEIPKTHPLTVTIYPDGQVLSETVGAKDKHGIAVPVPPHGRLIDADALINALQELFDERAREAEFCGNRGACVTWNDAIYHIKSAPTIIPAEEGET